MINFSYDEDTVLLHNKQKWIVKQSPGTVKDEPKVVKFQTTLNQNQRYKRTKTFTQVTCRIYITIWYICIRKYRGHHLHIITNNISYQQDWKDGEEEKNYNGLGFI